MIDTPLDSWFSNLLREANQEGLFCIKNILMNKYKYKIYIY